MTPPTRSPPQLKPVGMVFSVREVRAFLAFCEGAESNPVTLYFHEGGRPVLFVYEDQGAGGMGDFGLPGGSEGVQSVELVLATMEPALTAELVRGAGAGAGAGPLGGGAAAVGNGQGARRKAGGGERGAASAGGGAASVKEEKDREQQEQEEEDGRVVVDGAGADGVQQGGEEAEEGEEGSMHGE